MSESPLKCEDLLKALNDFVDGRADPTLAEEFRKHMAGCEPCRIVVDNVRGTITLFKAGVPYELPPAFRDRLHAALRKRWEQLFPAGPQPAASRPRRPPPAGPRAAPPQA
jgi:anti-sigma factor RsiW